MLSKSFDGHVTNMGVQSQDISIYARDLRKFEKLFAMEMVGHLMYVTVD